MAETANGDELVEKVVEVTACSPDEAKYFLAACANDVDAAVALFFEQGAAGVSSASGSGAATSNPVLDANGEEEVRAPIAPVREQLLLPEDDNFMAAGPSSNRLSRDTQRFKVCPFRDFAREGALLEEQLQATGVYSDPNAHRRRRDRAAQMVMASSSSGAAGSSRSATSRLGDLFRPPTDILYVGSLMAARDHATKRQRWLLVNVQGNDFQSHTMNRDVWSNKDLKKLVRRQFILWQVDDDTPEGQRFVAFYHCAKMPYLCIVDPRTGEEVWRSPEPKQENVLPDLKEFLREHRDFDQTSDAPTTSKRAAPVDDDDDDDVEEVFATTPKKRAKVLELTEEEQLELAIKNSMNENGQAASGQNNHSSSNCESLDGFDDDIQDVVASTSYESQLGQATTELTALKLRLLNESGTDEVVQLRWPSDTKLQTLRLYIKQTHKHIPSAEGGYKLICAFPRKSLESEHNQATLKELGLHPSANLHLTLDD
ncbi:uncharacterized protein [Drosophila tropicalis]|uniref:uncharacterized protein n=1 Tax=Drosophila tropicalis TaxID=46794 RepID=UPI0035ABD4F2